MNANYNKIIVSKGQILNLSVPKIMAIINITPDSFYSGSRKETDIDILSAASEAIENGASILDIGSYSSRPGADFVEEKEEIARLDRALSIIRKEFPDVLISIDTFRGAVAEMAVKRYGADIINDISAGTLDSSMLPKIAELQVPYIMMHIKGTPETMQSMTQYGDLLPDILRFFAEKIEHLRNLGFDKEIIIDPGFGFAKNTEQNYELLNHLNVFQCFKAPILVGVSRKTMIWKPLGITPDKALNGTTALNCFALERGADILRVHDVKEAVEAVKLHQLLINK